jgi:hypothetical protein
MKNVISENREKRKIEGSKFIKCCLYKSYDYRKLEKRVPVASEQVPVASKGVRVASKDVPVASRWVPMRYEFCGRTGGAI